MANPGPGLHTVLLPGSSFEEVGHRHSSSGAVFFAGGVQTLVGLTSLTWQSRWSAHEAPG